MKIAEMFDSMSEVYDEKVEKTNYIGPSWLLENLSSFGRTRAETCLDLGCANGINIKNLLEMGLALKATGVDISAAMIRSAQKRNLYEKLYMGNLDQGLSFIGNNSFDLVLALGCLEFLYNIEFCLDEIRRVIVPGGEIYGSFQLFEPGDKIALRQTRSGSVIHHAYSKGEVLEMLEERGFSLRKMESCTGYTGGYPCPYLMVVAKAK